jgi:hypothetical protein
MPEGTPILHAYFACRRTQVRKQLRRSALRKIAACAVLLAVGAVLAILSVWLASRSARRGDMSRLPVATHAREAQTGSPLFTLGD